MLLYKLSLKKLLIICCLYLKYCFIKFQMFLALFAIVGFQFALSQQINPNDLEVVLNIEDSNKTQYHEQNFDTSE